jgi:hypothetical protein
MSVLSATSSARRTAHHEAAAASREGYLNTPSWHYHRGQSGRLLLSQADTVAISTPRTTRAVMAGVMNRLRGNVHAHSSGRQRLRVRMPVRLHPAVLACLLLCTSAAAAIGFVRELAHSPAAWPVAVTAGVAGAVGSIAAWQRFRRMARRRVIKSRLVNALAGVLALGFFLFLMAIFSQVYGDMMYRLVPISWLADSGVSFHPNRPSLPVDGSTAFLLSLLLALTVATVMGLLGRPGQSRLRETNSNT